MHVGLCHPRVLTISLIGFACLFAGWAANSEAEGLPIVGSPSDRAADFDQMWHEVSDNYVYLGDRAASWAGARSRYTARIAATRYQPLRGISTRQVRTAVYPIGETPTEYSTTRQPFPICLSRQQAVEAIQTIGEAFASNFISSFASYCGA